MSYVHSDGMGAITSGLTGRAGLAPSSSASKTPRPIEVPAGAVQTTPSKTPQTLRVPAGAVYSPAPSRSVRDTVKDKYKLPPRLARPASTTIAALVAYLVACMDREQKIRSALQKIGQDIRYWERKINENKAEINKARQDLARGKAALIAASARARATGTAAAVVEKKNKAKDVVELARKVSMLSERAAKYLAIYKATCEMLNIFLAELNIAKKDTLVARQDVVRAGTPPSQVPMPTPQEQQQQQQQEGVAVTIGQQAGADIPQQTQENIAVTQETAAAVQEAVSTDPSVAPEAQQVNQELQRAAEETTAPPSLDTPAEVSADSSGGGAASPEAAEGGFGKILPWLAVAGLAAVVLMRK